MTPRRHHGLGDTSSTGRVQIALRPRVTRPKLVPLKYHLTPPLRSLGASPDLGESFSPEGSLEDSPTVRALERRNQARAFENLHSGVGE